MKSLLFICSMFFLTSSTDWLTNFDEAQKIAKEKNEYILLNFSGSDWCGPCIRMKKEIFESDAFKQYATDHLVLVNADFPRSKKNKLSSLQVKHNESLADKFNPNGKFPFTILIDQQGKVVKSWDGFPNSNATEFVNQLKQFNEPAR